MKLLNVYRVNKEIIGDTAVVLFPFYLLFSHILYSDCRFPISSLTSPPSPPPGSMPFTSPQKRVGLSGTSSKYGITNYNRTRHIFSGQGWMRQPSRRKRVPETGKSQKQPLLHLLEVPQKHRATQP